MVNNAGLTDSTFGPLLEADFDAFERIMAVNVKGTMLGTQIAARHMAAHGGGSIVNISSVAHFRYDGGGAALYAVTKTAIARMTEALAVEWAHYNINVNAIAPGMFVSEMTDGMFARMGGDPAPHLPRKRVPVAAQMDSTLLYLVAPSSECVTGATIRIDDGQSARARM